MFCTGKEQLTCNSEKLGCEGCYFNDDKNKDEIKVGEYVRNEDGYIEKIDSFDKLTDFYKDEEGVLRKWEGEDVWGNEYSTLVVKHSSNIIDLIEVGDYVNGMEVITVYCYDEDGNDKDGLGICETDEDYAYYKYLEDINIYSIVTKEQFKSIKYRLEE